MAYRYFNLVKLREKIGKLGSHLLIMQNALENTVETIKINNIKDCTDDLIQDLEKIIDLACELEDSILQGEIFSLLKIRLGEIKSCLRILKQALAVENTSIDFDDILDLFFILVRISNDTVEYSLNVRSEVYENEEIPQVFEKVKLKVISSSD